MAWFKTMGGTVISSKYIKYQDGSNSDTSSVKDRLDFMGTDTLTTSSSTITGAINELKGRVLHGTADPTASQGNNGDIYIKHA